MISVVVPLTHDCSLGFLQSVAQLECKHGSVEAMRPNTRAIKYLSKHGGSGSGREAARVAVWMDFGLPEIRQALTASRPAMTFVLVNLNAAGTFTTPQPNPSATYRLLSARAHK